MCPRESTKNGRIGAHVFNFIIFVHSGLIFEIYYEIYNMKKNFMSLRNLWNFRNFSNFDVYILVEFESDQMSLRKSNDNGRNGAYGFNSIIFVNSKLIFEICDENYPLKKFHVSWLMSFWPCEVLWFIFFSLNSRSFKELRK